MALNRGKQVRPLAHGAQDYAPQKGSTIMYAGGVVMIDSAGRAVKGQTATGLLAVGLAKTNRDIDTYDASALSDGAQNVYYEEGVFPMVNSAGGDAFSTSDQPGLPVFCVDDETAAKTSGGGARSPLGRLHHVDSVGVWVEVSKRISAELMQQGQSLGAAEQISAAGALAPFLPTSILNVSGSKAYTLGDGLIPGQRKRIFCRAAASTPSGVVTPAHANNFATVTFASANAHVELEWNGTGWDLVGVGGTVTIA
jgi:hypothetical protein